MRIVTKGQTSLHMIDQSLLDYYRCGEDVAEFSLSGNLAEPSGYFTFGDTICFGRCSSGPVFDSVTNGLHDSSHHVQTNGSVPALPFDPNEVITNLKRERYMTGDHSSIGSIRENGPIYKAYYFVRPLLSVGTRKHLQRLALRGWKKRAFPKWPVDLTVERLQEKCLMHSMKAKGLERVPFIWFWPEGHSSCGIITHDVETEAGRQFSSALMDIDDAFGIKTSFQIVPEERYTVTSQYLDSIRKRGFEVNVQDLNHDGRLFCDLEQFQRRAGEINRYVKEYDAHGFRAGALYRNVEWYEFLNVQYDMSVPNCAHLDPQRGGCCTVFPYFIGEVLEIPVTAIQDYSLFHIIGDYSIDVWKEQVAMIMKAHGIASIIIHPDYVIEERPQKTYRALLEYLSMQRAKSGMWVTLPRNVNHWWRQRSQMKLVCDAGRVRIEGEGKERACIAYAHIENDRLVYSLKEGH